MLRSNEDSRFRNLSEEMPEQEDILGDILGQNEEKDEQANK